MKQKLCLILVLALIVSVFSSCAKTPEETTLPSASTPGTTASPSEPAVPTETVDAALEDLKANLPRMDGSTSLIPLEAGVRAALFGKSMEEATAEVSHTSSWSSFYNLLSDTVDLVFSVPLSAEQERIAAEQGVVLEAVPIAMEGFVFVVNAENPVDTLTQQQIRDIYSGKITNWAQVGGLDEEIIPYQRNYDSGSQNYMIEFMGGTSLMDAPVELRPASMAGLMDVIAVNDNSRAAIGYSVYAYAADMYGNGNEIKFIKVDGVAPSKQAFANGSYPLMGRNYAVYNANEPQDSYVRQLVDWMCSDEGQYAIAQAGYVTIRDIGYDYTEPTLSKYQGTGTGPAAGTLPTYEYQLIERFHVAESWGEYYYYNESLELTEGTTPEGNPTWHITQLADSALEDEINRWIDSQMGWVAEDKAAMRQYVDEMNKNSQYDRFEIPELIPCIVTAKNGYLSVLVTLRFWEGGMTERYKYHRSETATWDLITGQRLEAEDLFCQGVDIDNVLNTYIREFTQAPQNEFLPAPEMKQEFVCLSENGWHVAHDAIYIDYGSADFAYGERIPLDRLPDGVLVTEQPRDFSDALEGNALSRKQFRISQRDLTYHYTSDQLVSFCLLDEKLYPEAAQVNAYVTNYLNTYYTEEAILSYFTDLGLNPDLVDLSFLDWYLENWGGRYLYHRGFRPYYYDDGRFVHYPFEICCLYDLKTQTHISWQDLLMDGWQDAVIWDEDLIPSDPENAYTDWFILDNGDRLRVCLVENGLSYYMSVPADYIIY